MIKYKIFYISNIIFKILNIKYFLNLKYKIKILNIKYLIDI